MAVRAFCLFLVSFFNPAHAADEPAALFGAGRAVSTEMLMSLTRPEPGSHAMGIVSAELGAGIRIVPQGTDYRVDYLRGAGDSWLWAQADTDAGPAEMVLDAPVFRIQVATEHATFVIMPHGWSNPALQQSVLELHSKISGCATGVPASLGQYDY